MHATIFGNVATIISRMYSKRQEYEMKVLDLEHFVSVHKLPKNLKQRWIDMYATMLHNVLLYNCHFVQNGGPSTDQVVLQQGSGH